MRREYVALAALILAITVSLPFILSNGEGAPTAPQPPVTAVLTSTPTPVPPTSTPTPMPDRGILPAPALWSTVFYRDLPGGRDEDEMAFLETLDLSFPTAPFGEYGDGAWGVLLTTTWTDLPAGRYRFRLVYDCRLTITANGVRIVSQPDPEGAATLDTTFVHEGGDLELTIEARDTPGPFVLRWLP